MFCWSRFGRTRIWAFRLLHVALAKPCLGPSDLRLPVMSQLLREIKQPYWAVSVNKQAGATSKRCLRVSDCMLLYCKLYLLYIIFILQVSLFFLFLSLTLHHTTQLQKYEERVWENELEFSLSLSLSVRIYAYYTYSYMYIYIYIYILSL